MAIFSISLIIPTYRREKQVNKIIKKIQKQINNDINIELIICDSFSNYNLLKKNLKLKNFKIRYLNIKKNNLSAKRNYGIKKSSYKNIILLDDDCIPKKNFISNFIYDLKLIDNKTILSGIVEYPKRYISKYNHIKYRNLKHFKKDKNFYYELKPDKIVAMSMAFKRTHEISKLGFFNEKFTGYGFEDHEFANRYHQNGFKLMRSKAAIVHDEGKPNIEMYRKKFYHLGRDGMRNLIKIDNSLAKSTIYYRIERNLLIKYLYFIPLIDNLLLCIEKIIINTDKIKNFKFLFLYDYLRLFSYIRGYIDRKKKRSKLIINNWYDQ